MGESIVANYNVARYVVQFKERFLDKEDMDEVISEELDQFASLT